MERINAYPGTLEASEWLSLLHEYQECAGYGRLPTQQEDRALCQWVERMRRMARAGQLPARLALDLARYGIRLGQHAAKAHAANPQAEAAFRKNMARLQVWMDEDRAASRRKAAHISYQNTRADKDARQCYTFLEHMRLKMRQGLLWSEHYWDLVNLPLLINGASVAHWLDAGPSLRKGYFGEELKVDRYPLVGQVRVDAEMAAREGQSGEVYVPGTGVLSVIVEDGELETERGYPVRTTDWRRMLLEPGEPTLVSLPDLGRYGVLSFHKLLHERAEPSLRAQYAARQNQSKSSLRPSV